MSRSASAAPRSPATVENRANISQLLPTWLKIAAFVYREMSWVTRNVPKAPEPLACMRRSGMTSRAKWATRAGAHAVLVVRDGGSRRGGQRLGVFLECHFLLLVSTAAGSGLIGLI